MRRPQIHRPWAGSRSSTSDLEAQLENASLGSETSDRSSRKTNGFGQKKTNGLDDETQTVVSEPPPYEAVVATRENAAPNHVLPPPPLQYADQLRDLKKRLRKRNKATAAADDAALRQRLAQADTFEEAHEIVALALMALLVAPDGEHDLDAERLATYTLDSITGIRIFQWAKTVLHVELTSRDLRQAELRTIDDVAVLIASKFALDLDSE